jgi:hypothetical protein
MARWREGLLRDQTRPSRIAPFGPEVGERIVALTLAEPPGETTYWTGRAMAKAAGVSTPIWQRSRQFGESRKTCRSGPPVSSSGRRRNSDQASTPQAPAIPKIYCFDGEAKTPRKARWSQLSA